MKSIFGERGYKKLYKLKKYRTARGVNQEFVEIQLNQHTCWKKNISITPW